MSEKVHYWPAEKGQMDNAEELGEYIEGDVIKMPPIDNFGQLMMKYWKNNTVPYVISPAFCKYTYSFNRKNRKLELS